MGGAGVLWKAVWGPLALLLLSPGLGWCPPKWTPYRDEFCLYLPSAPALSWKQARVFCQDQKADLVVIKDYGKQMFLRDLTEGARGHASYFWIGLAWREAQLTWVDGTPISQSWYSHWLQGHPREKHCTQLVGIYAAQWRDWDCESNTSFICEKPMKGAFSSRARKVCFRSHCYVFHFPPFWEQRSWAAAQSFCQGLGGNLAIIHDEEENTFLSSAFPEEGWHLWIGLRLGALWRWSDASAPTYLRWHAGPSAGQDQCAVLSLQPRDGGQHGMWEARTCQVRPTAEYIGFVCQLQYGECNGLRSG
ncbi:macrophage mannose receptor 1-like [Erythrolamprus reginae]|uniref:macrophage mannose receptor 1-like n=1 Tax=Erythrolamprus reginae TaxID=121349 RepID=UPI00396C8922